MATKGLLVCDRELVRKKWGKTATDVEEYVRILKQWMKSQKHLPEIPSDNIIEFFLTNNKYSVEKTKQNLDMYYTIHNLIPEFICHPLKLDQERILKMGHLVVLPKLTDSLHRILLFKLAKGGADVFDMNQLIAYGANLYEVRLHEDLVMGEIFVADIEHMTMQHILKFTPTIFKNLTFLLEKLLSNRVKEIHLVNHPPFIDKLLSLAKLFMNKKLYDRITLHSNMESLFKNIPQEIFPSDFGGKEVSLDTFAKMWKLKFEEYKARFDFLESVEINENLRPAPLINSEVLGYYGNFKKLDLD